MSHVFGGSFQHNILNRHMCTHMILQLGFTEKMSFWPRRLVGYITANGWLATASQMPYRGTSNFSISLVCSKKFKCGKNKVNW